MTQLPTYPDSHPRHPRACLRPYPGRGLFITGTATGVGKTVVTAALAGALRRRHLRPGLCKPIASGCPKRPGRGNDPAAPLQDADLEPLDSLIAARAAGLDTADEALLAFLAPLRFAAPVSPHIAAQLEHRPVDWPRVAAALDWWQENCDLLLVEGAGGWYVPLDQHDFMIADLAAALRLPVLLVTDAQLGTLNQTLLTVHAIRQRNLVVAGLVINRVPPEGQRDLPILTNLEELPRLTGVPVRAILPDLPTTPPHGLDQVPQSFIDLLLPFAREWSAMPGDR